MFGFLENSTFSVMQKGLDGLWARQRMVSQNLANHDTPGYKAQYVTFEETLNGVIDRNRSGRYGKDSDFAKDLRAVDIKIEENTWSNERYDGNNVDVDAEGVEMARAQIEYYYLVRQLNDEFSRLRYAINEGRR